VIGYGRVPFAPLPSVARAAGVVCLGLGAAVAAVHDPKLAIAGVVGLGLCVLVVAGDLAVALVTFTVLTFFEHLPSIGSDVTVVKGVGALMTFAWAVRLVDARMNLRFLARDHPLVTYTVATFFVFGCLSALWAQDSHATLSAALRLAQVIILLFVTYSALREPKHLRWMMWAYCLGVALTTSWGLASGLTSGNGRLAGGILDPNFLAATILVGIVFAIFLLSRGATPAARLALLALLAVLVPSFFMTQSRGGLVALAVTVVAGWLFAGPVRANVIVMSLVVCAAAIGYYTFFATATQRERLSNISASGSSGRADEWRIALRMTGDHPLVGIGLNNFRTVEPSYITSSTPFLDVRELLHAPQTHNTYLQTLSELGAVGLTLLLAILGSTVALGITAARRLAAAGRVGDEIVVRGIVLGAIGLVTAYFFLPGLYEKQLWLLLGLMVAATAMTRPAGDAAE